MVDLRAIFASGAIRDAIEPGETTGNGVARKTTSIAAAQEAYAYAADYIERGEPLPPDLARFVAGALREVSQCGGSGDAFKNQVMRAMRLYRSKGYKDRRHVLDAEYSIWRRYDEIRDNFKWDGAPPKIGTRDRQQWDEQIGLLEQELGLGLDRIQQIVAHWDAAEEEYSLYQREELRRLSETK